MRRADVAKRFSGPAVQASRDLALYKELVPENLVYDFQAKTYLPGKQLRLVFNRTPERVMCWSKSGLGGGLPHRQGLPKLGELAVVTRAIYRRQVLDGMYVSLASGRTDMQAVPHSLVEKGQRWHVRAYDRANASSSDLLTTRISKAVVSDGSDAVDHERQEADEQWNRMVELNLVPHPKLKHRGAVEADDGMGYGALVVKCRAAWAGDALRCWGVDCSTHYHLDPVEFQLALTNQGVLKGIGSSQLAPGYGSRAGSA